MKDITTITGDTAQTDDAYLDLYKEGKIIKDTDGCYYPFYAVETVCDEADTAKVGTAKVGSAVVG